MNTNPTPLDLDAIRARSDARRHYADERPESLHDPEDYAALADESAADVPALVAEVERLRAEVRLARESARSAGLAPGARRTARPAPAWDEEAVQAEVLGIDARHHFHGTACLCGFDSHGRARSATEHITSAVLAVVRDHLQ